MDDFVPTGVFNPMMSNSYSSIEKYYNVHTIWLAMIALTLSTYVLAELGFSGTAVMFFLLFSAIVKANWIIRDFMELRGVSLLWRIIMYGWLWSICIAIAITYLINQ